MLIFGVNVSIFWFVGSFQPIVIVFMSMVTLGKILNKNCSFFNIFKKMLTFFSGKTEWSGGFKKNLKKWKLFRHMEGWFTSILSGIVLDNVGTHTNNQAINT